MQTFQDVALPQRLQSALSAMGFNEPTPIQAQAIPHALEGKDILGSAQTGTGKTGAFAIPMVARLIKNPEETALILTPTRELAMQVIAMVEQLVKGDKTLRTALLIGGDSMFKQLKQLKTNPRIIVGTPGRINDHLARGTVSFENAGMLVLDETDRMLDMGFGIQIASIVETMPSERQTLLFSATLPSNINALSKAYLTDPVRIAVGNPSSAHENIKQDVVWLSNAEKQDRLLEELHSREGSIIIFVKTKRNADQLALKLETFGHRSEALHGDLRQNKRERITQAYRKERFRILVATDVAARGLDIPHIRHVINYDLPQSPEDYIHRIGRTARAEATGEALSLVAPQDKEKWFEIQRLLDPKKAQEDAARQRQGGRNSKGAGKGYGARKSSGYGAKASDFGASYGSNKRGAKPVSRSKGKSFSDGFMGEKSAPRQRFGDEKPFGKPSYGERSERSYGDRNERFGSRQDRPSFERDSRPSRPFGERSERSFGERSERTERPYNNRPERGNRFGDDRPARQDRQFSDRSERGSYERSERSFGERRERSGNGASFAERGPRTSYGRDAGREGGRDNGFAPKSKPFASAYKPEGKRFSKAGDESVKRFSKTEGAGKGGFKKSFDSAERPRRSEGAAGKSFAKPGFAKPGFKGAGKAAPAKGGRRTPKRTHFA